ncbi:MAG: alanine racemase [Candidatus Ratteibacteria bacterium]|nr:alanine racemase [Candidatus Ratteibacteria bacterium]
MQPTKVIVSLKAIKNNIEAIRRKIGKDVKILACVKTDAYGHGIEKVSKVIHKETEYLAVASVGEGALLRNIGIKLPILVLNCILKEEVKNIVKYDLTQTLCSFETAYALNKASSNRHKIAKVHIDIDTGMGRIGIRPSDVIDFIKKVKKLNNLNIEGIYTHFPSADDDEHYTHYQLKTFEGLIKKLEAIGINIPLKHTANSAAIMNFPKTHFNMIRPGLMIYGYYPSPSVKKTVKLEPAMSFTTKIISLRELPKGTTISYGRTHTTPRPSMIATLPTGYGDGYSRALSNKGQALIRGKRAPIVGRICMDQTMVDVTGVPKAKIGDEVVLIGKRNKEIITVEEVASLAGTIPYEITCMIGKNTERIYKK